MGRCNESGRPRTPDEDLNLTSHALPYLAVARAKGPDAGAFLQAQLSADLESLRDGDATFACYCSPRGQVYGLLLVCREAGSFVLVGAAELLPSILERLRRFVLRARVQFEPAADLVVCGAPAERVAAAGVFHTVPGLSYRVADQHECESQDGDGWKARELQHGVAWLSAQTSERFIPQMLGFDQIGAVSFSKGCYPGQEIVARARYLGTVKRKPLRLLVAAAPMIAPGAVIRVQAGEAWLDGVAIDSAPLGKGRQRMVFVVAAMPAGTVKALEFEERSYRCATM
jgi:folate-binding protein YgfZ